MFRTPATTERFRIKGRVDGAEDKIHLEIVLAEVEETILANQVWRKKINEHVMIKISQCKVVNLSWSQVSRNLRRDFPESFLRPDGRKKDTASMARICANAVTKYDL